VLANYVKVKSASLENGLLHVGLVRESLEAMKPQSIPIASSSQLLEVKPTKVAASGAGRLNLGSTPASGALSFCPQATSPL
jgi:hypothetical protein